MHIFLGYSLSEWLTLLSIIGVVGSYLIWLVSHFITKPLSSSINNLSEEIKDFKQSSKEEHIGFKTRIDHIEQNVIDHEVTLTKHDEEIKTLFENAKK